MVKSHTTISIDTHILEEAKLYVRNMSGEFEQFLASRISQAKGVSNGISLVVLQKKLKVAEEEETKARGLSQTLREQVRLLQKQLEEKEIKRLEEEKIRIEEVKRCVLCKAVLESKQHTEFAWTEDNQEFRVHHHCLYSWISMRNDQGRGHEVSMQDLKAYLEQQIEVDS